MTAGVIDRKELMRRQRVTAVVFSGTKSSKAGLQIRVDGKIFSGHILPFANKKKPLRICVAGPEGRSSVWNAWANKNVSDVYIAIRSSASLHKISLHESGDFRYQLIGATKATLERPDLAFVSTVEDDGSRILHKWQKPELNNTGWRSCVSLVVPASELQPQGVDNPKEIVWLPAPPRGHAIEVQGFLVHPGVGELDLTDAMSAAGPVSAVGGFKLPNGEVFVMISATILLSPQSQKMIRVARGQGRRGIHANFDWSAENAPRMLMIATGKGVCLSFVDARG
jgi:hypothetical protein